MDEHKNSKKPGHPASLDGFVSDGRVLGVPPPRAYRPDKAPDAPVLGNYINRTDGFHPIRQAPRDLSHTPEAAEVGALLNEPIVLDESAFQPEAKKRFAKKHPKARRRFKRTSMIIASLLVLFGAYFGAKFYLAERNLLRGGGKAPALADSVDINQLKGEGDGRINILLLGIGGAGHEGGFLTDTIILLSIDPVNNKAAMLSIPRDLWVKVPGNGYQKINAAYAYGKDASRAKTEAEKEAAGLKLLDDTLSPILGVPIHYNAVVNFKAFQQMVDSVGGVDVNVPANLTANENFWIEGTNRYYQLSVPAGQQHFDGTRALYYARERHNDSDFARSQRQRLVLESLKGKVLSAGTFSNPVKISSLLNSVGNNVYTDFSVDDLSRLYKIGKNIKGATASLDLVTPPNAFLTTSNINGLSVVIPRAGQFNYDAIQSYVRNAMKDSYIAKENAKIAIYNATTVDGLATASGNKLKSFGYNVTTIDNAPTQNNPATSVIVDLTKGKNKYTQHYLEQRFGVTSVSSIPASVKISPPADSSFVIILGRDAANSSKTSFAN